jgi:spermidine synthase
MHRRYFALFGLLAFAAAALVALAATEDKVLYEKKSAFSTITVTEDEQGLRTLMFDRNGVRQSVAKPGNPDHLELAYSRVMPVGCAVGEEPRRVLIVGLGGGTIPSFLRKHFPKMVIDVVELDPDVVDVAKRFFGFREDDAMHAYAKDGRKFIENCRQPYDVIFLDAFGPNSIPYDLATKEFLTAVRKALAPKGIVVANVWNGGSNELYDSMLRTYQEVFDDLYAVEVRGVGNEILIGLKYKGNLTRDELVRRAAKVSKDKQFPHDMGPLVEAGFRHDAEQNPRGEVLRDKEK